jgi:hypothetical protein
MPIARIENGTFVEQRDMALADVPEHKRAAWRPVEGDPPSFDLLFYSVTGPVLQIEPTRVLRVWTAAPRDLATVKAETKMAISVAAENARLQYITPGSGKAMSYQQVAAEARTYVITGGAGVYPFLQARVSSGRYADLAAAAAGTIAIEQKWAAVGSVIDRIEDAAKFAIDAATTVEQVQAAMQVTWP